MLVKLEKVFSWCNKQFRRVNKSNSSRNEREYTYLRYDDDAKFIFIQGLP